MSHEKRPLVRAGEAVAQNRNSQVKLETLSKTSGMSRIGVSRLIIPPGEESLIYHDHQTEETFIYVISGHGNLEADGEETGIGPGDFIGVPALSVAHLVENPNAEDLICLTGAEIKRAPPES